jgi:hypothetical protein
LPKRRLSLNDLLDLLGLGDGREATYARLEDFQRLFAYKLGVTGRPLCCHGKQLLGQYSVRI